MGLVYKYMDVSVSFGEAATSIEGLINSQATDGWELHTMTVTMQQVSGERIFGMVFQKRTSYNYLPLHN